MHCVYAWRAICLMFDTSTGLAADSFAEPFVTI